MATQADSSPDVDSKAGDKRSACTVVGIGASAGGLEALERFLCQVPADSGLAFVVVQHLDPTREGIMPELLQRVTSMPVFQAKEAMKIVSDHVYVIPPNRVLTVADGELHLQAPDAPRGLRLPVDAFLRSLAADQRERSVGVILSGMGSDGTLGLGAIKESAGLTLAQEPATARYASMPESAARAGVVDVVAPPEELCDRILTCLALKGPIDARLGGSAPAQQPAGSGLEQVIRLLRTKTGNDFSRYKPSTLQRRIARRMGVHQIDVLGDYVRYLQENPHEVSLLFKEILIGVTHFFRDPPVWEALGAEILPPMLATVDAARGLRAWVPGCSTGEEAYSLVMTLLEAQEALGTAQRPPIQVFATDLDPAAIEHARSGRFPASIAAQVSEERLARFFVEVDGGYRARDLIRERLVFATQNVIMDPPFTKLDIVSCRNLLIYLSAVLQDKLVPLFHHALNPGGVLLLGSAETLGGAADLFQPIDRVARLFRRRDSALSRMPIDFPSSFVAPRAANEETSIMTQAPTNLSSLAERIILQRFSPAAALVNERGDLLYTSARTGKYLEPPLGKANLNLFAMAREGLRQRLSVAFHEALRRRTEAHVHGVEIGTNGGSQQVDVTVHPIMSPEDLRGTMLIVFSDVAAPLAPARHKHDKTDTSDESQCVHLEETLRSVQEQLRATREEMQGSHEELKAANEELQSTNEELQSTNEELTTSKEEMQSLNEELQTVNAELQSRLDDLSRANSDMANLLNSTEIGTVFLDGALNVRRFTERATGIFKLISSDVGRPLSDLATDLHYPRLLSDAREVLRTLAFKERQVKAHDGSWYRVRVMPYRTMDDRIDGLVITFIDVTAERVFDHTKES